MRETHLDTRFLAHSYGKAVEDAVAHAHERYENYFKHPSYKDSFLSSIKVYLNIIQPMNDDGSTNGSSAGCFFEWKYDWPCSLDEAVESYLQTDQAATHPAMATK